MMWLPLLNSTFFWLGMSCFLDLLSNIIGQSSNQISRTVGPVNRLPRSPRWAIMDNACAEQRRGIVKKKAVPDAGPPTRERILSAAEHLFATHGYDATSLRDIAIKAETRIGLVSYHFQNKELLYETLIERRSAEIGRRRLGLLTRERKSFLPAAIPAERIIHAYTWPFLELSHSAGAEWKSYTKIISSVANSQRWTGLLSTYYDPVATVFLNELRRTFPTCSEAKLVAGFTFMVSVMLGIAAETGRADQLSNGAIRSTDIGRIFDMMLPFLSAGFERLGDADDGMAVGGRGLAPSSE
ncbi:UNVERIFIED_ORG: AcrR family transcriptional regulator [Xanthobacter viscosus]|nr:TetR/AcrR family transcriptional regulator [Xanthobacter autotrophicus]